MPYHWVPIDGHNPGPFQREAAVRKIVRKHGGTVLFCGFAGSNGFALIDTSSVGDLNAMRNDLGSAQKAATKVESSEEIEP
jgi:hypothetical protein